MTDQPQPKWYQEAIIYELHIRAFFDSNQDGHGDFRGLVQKLDYLQEIGITAIWLLPFYPSPLKDDGYDIANYTSIHPTYGDLADFKLFLKEAHQRNLRVITELVLNHTSDQHPWFQRARRAEPGSEWRNFYVWSDNPEKYAEARIIFKDFETSNWSWDPVAKAYYWHRFYSHQPDLNYDNPAVQKAAIEWLDFWMDLGVDGLRLDAVPYLFEREETHCENLTETHQFLKKLRQHIDEKYPGRMFLAEANQWPEDACAYFGDGDECNMAFHFPLMPRMFMSLQMEDRFPLVDIMQQTPAIPETCQWTLFLRNHDELTLEMVTEEERDYMYQTYAPDPKARINLGIRRRLAPLLNNNRRKIELMNGLLFSLPGTPVVYYGDEIGMGDNYYLDDRNSVRTPMQWNADRNAGFSQAHPQRLFLPVNIDPEYHYETVNVATQQNNPESLLWWMKKIIAIRKRYRAFSLGKLHFLQPDNTKILAYVTQYQDEKILVLANLSRFTEYVELDLSPWQGMEVLELFGQNPFPAITTNPYSIILGPHSFYWFLLSKAPVQQPGLKIETTPIIYVANDWDSILEKNEKIKLERLLPEYLFDTRWFNRKSAPLKSVTITEVIPCLSFPKKSFILLITTTSIKEENQIYFLPITFLPDTAALALKNEFPTALIAKLPTQTGYLIDACYDTDFTRGLVTLIAHNGNLTGIHGGVTGQLTAKSQLIDQDTLLEIPKPLPAEQSNTSILFGKKLLLKLYRCCHAGINPDLELLRFLSETAEFPHSPAISGFIEYHNQKNQVSALGLLEIYCPHETDAWRYSLQNLQHFFANIPAIQPILPTTDHWFGAAAIPEITTNLLGNYGGSMYLLGQRTAEMHTALASNETADYQPEPFTAFYQRSIYQSIRSLLGRTLRKLHQAMRSATLSSQPIFAEVLASSPTIEACIHQLLERKINGMRIRVHGDFHLGQVLYTGKDFVIFDFEGEPGRPLSERRIKRSPLRDVAGMIRSFDYAAATALLGKNLNLQPWAKFWRNWTSVYFLQGYFAHVQQKLLPSHLADMQMLLHILLLEKAIYEIDYELNNRPDQLIIPCQGLLDTIKGY